MGKTIRARVSNGLLEPLEPIALPEGKEITITILDLPTERDVEASRRAAGGWRGLVDADTLIRNIYADRLISTRSEHALPHRYRLDHSLPEWTAGRGAKSG